VVQHITNHHIHWSRVEEIYGPQWAYYAFLTFEQARDGWITLYTRDYERLFFHNWMTSELRWYPPNDEGGTGGAPDM
ncbi:unnamed protein product, partial [Prorocentrum cordatum]